MYTFEQHLPGKKQFAPLAQLAEQLTLNSKQLFGLFFPFLIWSGLAGTNQMVDVQPSWSRLDAIGPDFNKRRTNEGYKGTLAALIAPALKFEFKSLA